MENSTVNTIDFEDNTHHDNPDKAQNKLDILKDNQEGLQKAYGQEEFKHLLMNLGLEACGFTWYRHYTFEDNGPLKNGKLEDVKADLRLLIDYTIDDIKQGRATEEEARHQLFENIGSMLNFDFCVGSHAEGRLEWID